MVISEIIYDIDDTKGKTLEADSNLERSMTICQSIEKVLDTYKFYDEKNKQAILIHFLKRKNP